MFAGGSSGSVGSGAAPARFRPRRRRRGRGCKRGRWDEQPSCDGDCVRLVSGRCCHRCSANWCGLKSRARPHLADGRPNGARTRRDAPRRALRANRPAGLWAVFETCSHKQKCTMSCKLAVLSTRLKCLHKLYGSCEHFICKMLCTPIISRICAHSDWA